MIDLLRRIGAHRLLLPLTALLLRARTVRGSVRFLLREVRGGGRRATYRIRGGSIRIVLRHGSGDAVTLGEVFHQHDYEPPPPLAGMNPATILDLGANIGLFGAFAAQRWPLAGICAYEPDAQNADVCEACIAVNGLGHRWELRRAAAFNQDGEIRFSASSDALSHSDPEGDRSVAAEDVVPRMADSDLVKIDIEGGEWALLGDRRFAQAPPKAVVLEYHPYLCPGEDPGATVRELLDRAGLANHHVISERADGYGMLWGVAQLDAERDVLDTDAAGGMVIRGGALRAIGYIAATLLSVVSYALITRHLGVGRFGDYQTALSIVTVVGAVTEAGMTTLAVREYATLKGEDRERLMRNLLGARLGLTTVGVVAAVIVAVLLGFDRLLVAGTALAGIGIGLNSVQSMIGVPLAATLRIGTATLLDSARQVVLVVILVVVVLAGGGATALLAATIPAGVAGLLATAFVLRGQVTLRPVVHPSEWRRLILLTLPVALTLTAGTLYVYLVQVLTDTISSDFESGLFAASFRVFLVISAVPGLVVSTAFPLLARAARDDQERLRYALDRLFRTSVLAGAFVGITLAIGAAVAIDVVAGAGYVDAIPVLRVQAIALLASFPVATLGFALLTLRLHRGILIVNLLALCVSGGAALAVISNHGAIGAAWSSVAGESVLVLGYWTVLRMRRPELAPGFGAVAMALPPVAAACAVLLIPELPALPEAAMAAVLFAVVAVIVRAVPDELIQAVRGMLP